MVKVKAAPGKRYFKKCEELIPIHCRICSFCSTPQYTMQQITKEYKKRQKFTENSDPLDQYNSQFLANNNFITYIPILSYSTDDLKEYLRLDNFIIKFNNETILIPQLSYYKSEDFYILNPCGKGNCLAFSYGEPSYLVISICPGDVYIGNIYEGDGIIQIWKFLQFPVYQYSILHHGYTALDMKFLPTKDSEIVGSLAACLANGDLCIYNLPLNQSGLLRIQPIQVFNIPGLVFSCVIWMDLYQIAAGTQDGSIFYIRPGYEPIVKIYGAHKLPITSITWCPQKEYVASTGLDGYLKI